MALSAASATPAVSETVAEFYRGKSIRVIVSTAAGGDYDIWSRLVTNHMTKYLPGNPVFVVQNMPGAGGFIAANNLYNQAPKDGTVIGMIGRQLPFQALMKEDGVRFDPTKFGYIGSPELTHRVCVTTGKAAVQKAEDLFEKEILMGGAGAGTSVSTLPVLLSNLLGMKFKVVEGYGSASAVVLAIERGEVQGICQTYSQLITSKPDWFKSGFMKVLFNTESKPIPGVDAPTIYQFAKTEEQKQIIALYNSSLEFGRPMVTPPDIPADRLVALRQAFEAALADPDLKADADKQKLEIALVKGEDLEKLIKNFMATPVELVDKMQGLTKAK
jgi:tripartite-type tricarboxylate transporter receptor subunit TctC